MTETTTFNTTEPTGPRSRKQITAEYRDQFPELAAYLDIVHEHSGPDRSINEPLTGGIDTRQATRLALERIGRPARDDEDVKYAEAWIARLRDEIESQTEPAEKKISDFVIDSMFQYVGCMPTADDWFAQAGEDKDGDINDVIALIRHGVPADRLYVLLREVLEFAFPAILARITEDDEKRRAAQRQPVRIREADIAAVREHNRLEDVVREHVTLRDKGRGLLAGLCPFHEDTTTSFIVRPAEGIYQCLHCGEGGDLFTFVMKAEQIGFGEAVQMLAGRAGVQLTNQDGRRE